MESNDNSNMDFEANCTTSTDTTTGTDTSSSQLMTLPKKICSPPPCPLPPPVRHSLETKMGGADLSNVKIFQGHDSTLMGANSFNKGQSIFFAPGQYQPHTPEGQQLLHKEVTKMIQASPTASPAAGLTVPKGMAQITRTPQATPTPRTVSNAGRT
jgi:hypothetical protein